jgi:hypothetical protein
MQERGGGEMYGKAAGITTGTLPATGGMVLFPEYLWLFIAAFALLAVLGALWRLVPREEK